MSCEEIWNLISAEMDGELQADDKPKLEAHLAECAACRSLREGFKLDDADLRRAFVPRRKAALGVAERVASELRTAGRRSRGWRSFLQLAAAACLGFSVALLILRPQNEAPQAPGVAQPQTQPVQQVPMARLALATGTIKMRLKGSEAWQAMETGAAIAPETYVRTEPGALCEFRTSDGSDVRLNSEAEVLFQANRALELVRGQMWSSVARDESPFKVKVPDATVMALGTKFDLLCEPAETVLTMVEGTTRVQGKERAATVRAGFRARIVGGDVTESTRTEEVLLATNWVHKLLVLKGGENEELAKRLNDLLAYIGQGKVKMLYEREIRDLGPTCVKPLMSYIQSGLSKNDSDRRLLAAKILADLAPKWAVRDLIELLQDRDRKVCSHAARGLERLTGETQGLTADEWESQPAESSARAFEKWLSWWEENKSKYPQER